MNKRVLSMLLAMGLALSVFVGALGTGSAQAEPWAEDWNQAYFPWVPSGADLDGTGPWHGTVTVQNLEDSSTDIVFQVGSQIADGEFAENVVNIAPNASITLSAGDLDVSEPGDPVKVWGFQSGTVGDDDGTVVLDEAVPARIAASSKNAAPEVAPNARTSASHIIVDGYTALTGAQVVDGQHVLPIVQTNNNWNTSIKVANFSESNSLAPVTITLYESGGQGAAGPSSGEFTEMIRGGEVAEFDLVELGFAGEDMVDDPVNDWVGSAFISANVPVGAVAERIKAETDMLITNVSRPLGQDEPVQAAPLVFQEFNFWNTGISVANTDPNNSNTVSITYYGPTQNVVGVDQFTVPPRGMEYIYTPGTQDLGLGGVGQAGFVGSAVIEGSTTFQASVDEVKYFGVGEDVGHAMSYLGEWRTASGPWEDAEGNFYTGDILAMPLVQKGDAAGGGDTSGIQLFNPSADVTARAEITLYDPTGAVVAPTIDAPIPVVLTPHRNHTLYAHYFADLPAGFQGSAVIRMVTGEMVGVSNNVNYDVQFDGSAAFNLAVSPGVLVEAPLVVDIVLDPEDAENPFYGQAQIDALIVAAIEAELDALGIDIGEYDVADRLAAHGGDYAALVDEIADEFNLTVFQTGEVMTAAETAETEANQHTVTATVTSNGEAVTDALVEFTVEGANEADGLVELDEAGEAEFIYTATAAGDDTITATVPGAEGSATATKTWVVAGVADAITLEPEDATNPVATAHTVTALVTDQLGDPVRGVEVEFVIEAGPNAGATGVTDPDADGDNIGLTDGDGEVTFTYTGQGTGPDRIVATVAGTDISAEAFKAWTAINIEIAHAEGEESQNHVDTEHTVVATVIHEINNEPVEGVVVEFTIDGPNENVIGVTDPDAPGDNTGVTNADGQVFFTYEGADFNTDTITATVVESGDSAAIEKDWYLVTMTITPEEDTNPFFEGPDLIFAQVLVVLEAVEADVEIELDPSDLLVAVEAADGDVEQALQDLEDDGTLEEGQAATLWQAVIDRGLNQHTVAMDFLVQGSATGGVDFMIEHDVGVWFDESSSFDIEDGTAAIGWSIDYENERGVGTDDISVTATIGDSVFQKTGFKEWIEQPVDHGDTLTLAQDEPINPIGVPHEVTGLLQDDTPAGIDGALVVFDVISADFDNLLLGALTEPDGVAGVEYTRDEEGEDTILGRAYYFDEDGNLVVIEAANSLTKEWEGLQSNFAGTAVSSLDGPGAVGWLFPESAEGPNDHIFAETGPTVNDPTSYLLLTNFGFDIPDGATILGIEATIWRQSGISFPVGSRVADHEIRLLTGSSAVGDNRADTSTAWPFTNTPRSYGDDSDLWGATWTPSEINDAGFGLAIRADRFSGLFANAQVDAVEITVYYQL